MGRFESERQLLAEALRTHVVRIEHVGSTSVPGLAAKPIVDIAITLRTLAVIPDVRIRLAAFDYRYRGEEGIPGRHYFNKPIEPPGRAHRQVQLHVTQAGSAEFQKHVLFRDYLRAHPSAQDEYAALKRRLAEEAGDDIEVYIAGKTGFVTRCLEAAEPEQFPAPRYAHAYAPPQ
ncbi:MAG: hypothetical protein C0506_12035 [Anaerolinea sp.]|nr:hypothetical protein [Anaerolinea sp.]